MKARRFVCFVLLKEIFLCCYVCCCYTRGAAVPRRGPRCVDLAHMPLLMVAKPPLAELMPQANRLLPALRHRPACPPHPPTQTLPTPCAGHFPPAALRGRRPALLHAEGPGGARGTAHRPAGAGPAGPGRSKQPRAPQGNAAGKQRRLKCLWLCSCARLVSPHNPPFHLISFDLIWPSPHVVHQPTPAQRRASIKCGDAGTRGLGRKAGAGR